MLLGEFGLANRTAVGLDNKTVAEYCLKGIIKSGRRASKRLTQQGGAPHDISRTDLRQFVIENVELIDFRKVDKFALVDLLVATESPVTSSDGR